MFEAKKIQLVDWGLKPYEEIWAWQKVLVEQRAKDKIPDTLLMGEHWPVFTQGRKSPPDESLPTGIPILQVERGGETTYHAPGQLVLYPIRKLDDHDLRAHLRWLENWGIEALKATGLNAYAREGLTGLWAKQQGDYKKLASIGVAVKHWVSYHGIAVNVSMDLMPYQKFRPCGLSGDSMSDLESLLGRDISIEQVKTAFIASLQD